MEQTLNLRKRPESADSQADRLAVLSRRKEINIKGVRVVLGLWENYRTGLPKTPHFLQAARLYIRDPDGSLLKTVHDVDVLVCHGKREGMGPLTSFDDQSIDKVVRTLREAGYNVDALAVCNEIGGKEINSLEINSDIEALDPPVIFSKGTKVNVDAELGENATITVGLQPSVGGEIIYKQFEEYRKVPTQ